MPTSARSCNLCDHNRRHYKRKTLSALWNVAQNNNYCRSIRSINNPDTEKVDAFQPWWALVKRVNFLCIGIFCTSYGPAINVIVRAHSTELLTVFVLDVYLTVSRPVVLAHVEFYFQQNATDVAPYLLLLFSGDIITGATYIVPIYYYFSSLWFL